jgi:hypothetical protein
LQIKGIDRSWIKNNRAMSIPVECLGSGRFDKDMTFRLGHSIVGAVLGDAMGLEMCQKDLA